MLRFSKGYCSHSFHPISAKLYRKHGIGEIEAVTFSVDLPNAKSIWHYEDKLSQLNCHCPQSYGGLIRQKVKQREFKGIYRGLYLWNSKVLWHR